MPRTYSKGQLYGRQYRYARKRFLAEHPLCRMCEEQGRVTPAVELDHIVKHNGDPVLFWDESNWQGLCYHCHRSVKARMERSGKTTGSRVDGLPLDPKHHWH